MSQHQNHDRLFNNHQHHHCRSIQLQNLKNPNNFGQQNLYEYIKQHFLELSLDKYGCRIVQNAIETTTPKQCEYLLDRYTVQDAMCLAWHETGNRVIQCIFREAASTPKRDIQVIDNNSDNKIELHLSPTSIQYSV